MYATIFLQSGEVLKLHYLEETVNKDQGSRFLMELVSNSLVTAPSRSCTFGNKVIECTMRQLKRRDCMRYSSRHSKRGESIHVVVTYMQFCLSSNVVRMVKMFIVGIIIPANGSLYCICAPCGGYTSPFYLNTICKTQEYLIQISRLLLSTLSSVHVLHLLTLAHTSTVI